MEPAVGDLVDESKLIHGKLYYVKFPNSDAHYLGFFDKQVSYESPLPFVFVHEPSNNAIDYDSYTVYEVKPENYMTNEIKRVKNTRVSSIPSTMRNQVIYPVIGHTYYFYKLGALKPIKGVLRNINEVYSKRSNESYEIYDVKTATGIEHFPVIETTIYEAVTRNNALKNAKTIRKMIRNKGANRTIRNITNITSNANNIHNRRKHILKFYQNAWNDAAKN